MCFKTPVVIVFKVVSVMIFSRKKSLKKTTKKSVAHLIHLSDFLCQWDNCIDIGTNVDRVWLPPISMCAWLWRTLIRACIIMQYNYIINIITRRISPPIQLLASHALWILMSNLSTIAKVQKRYALILRVISFICRLNHRNCKTL